MPPPPARPSYTGRNPTLCSGEPVMATGTFAALLGHVRRTAGADAAARVPDDQLLERFVAGRDEQAFAALVRRHGGLVLAACRRTLADETDVEDAFQAAFLTLVCKAGSIRRGQALGSWLYRVAARAAGQVRLNAERRRRHERPGPEPAAPAADPSWREACAVLHDELARLPERLRLPLLLCYLEGKTRDEAARQLGWSLGTLRGRLERGRHLLRARLDRRGVTLAVGLGAAVATPARSAVPARLVAAPLRALAAAEPAADTITARGTVLDPDGRPVAGATVRVTPDPRSDHAEAPAARAVTG